MVSPAAGAHCSTVHVRTLVACAVFVWHRTSPFVFSCFPERVGGEPVLKGQNDIVPPLTSLSHHLIGSTLRPWWAHDGSIGFPLMHVAILFLPLFSSRECTCVVCTSRFTDIIFIFIRLYKSAGAALYTYAKRAFLCSSPCWAACVLVSWAGMTA